MKKLLSSAIVLIGFFITSCTTVTLKPDSVDLPRPAMHFQNDNMSTTLNCKNSHWAEILIENKTDKVITLQWDLSSFSPISGSSQRLIPEGTKYSQSQQSVPPVAIAPGTKFVKSFTSADGSYYESGQYGGWRDLPWIPKDLNGSKFVFGYRLDNKDDFIIFDGNESSKNIVQPEQPIGTVTYSKTYWNILFLKSVDSRRSELLQLAKEKAKKQYGNDIELANIAYSGSWKPESLILYFSMLGFVEKASISADVMVKK
jgi:hypothetical protein